MVLDVFDILMILSIIKIESYFASSVVFYIVFAQDYDDSFSLLCNNNGKDIDCLYHNLFTHPTADGHLGCFEFVVNVDHTTLEHSSLCILAHVGVRFCRYIPQSGITGSQERGIFNFPR